MKGQVLFEQGSRQRGEMLAFAGLGIAGMVTILLAVSAMVDLEAGRDQVAASLSGGAPTVVVSGAGTQKVSVADTPKPITGQPVTATTIDRRPQAERPVRIGISGPHMRSNWLINF